MDLNKKLLLSIFTILIFPISFYPMEIAIHPYGSFSQDDISAPFTKTLSDEFFSEYSNIFNSSLAKSNETLSQKITIEHSPSHTRKPFSIDELTINDKIGHGAFASVYECLVPDEEKSYALKIISGRHKTRIPHEIEILTNLNHPNIVRLIHIIYQNHGSKRPTGFTMPIFQTDLYDFTTKNTEALKNNFLLQCEIALKIAHGLKYLHNNNIIHKDLKPENILLNVEPFQLAISDFEFAECYNGGNTQKRCGTPTYLAPETMFQKSTYLITKKSDIYSFGIVLYFISECKCPYKTKNPRRLLKYKLQNKIEKIRKCNPFKEIITACIQQNAYKRPSIKNIIENLFVIQEELQQTR